MTETFFWHDYETTGIDPARDRPIQFAGVRTDAELNICDDPLELYCQVPADCLPHPKACAVTGISPQTANQRGVPEREFIAQIHREMSEPGTCSVGYNSIRFDDEFTRYTLYRNFYDAYEREYKNGNSRWDIIDVVRLCCALRPDEIEWPLNDDGSPSFRLEKLSAANGIAHQDAHDALSDVTATIELAKIIRQRKPRLFEYALQLRNKRFVAGLLNTKAYESVLHVSSKLPNEFYCASLMLPVGIHPTNSNGVICVDLRHDPEPLFDLDAAELARYLYLSAAERDGSEPQIPLKVIHLNRSPIVATAKLLDNGAAERIRLDPAQCQKHMAALKKNTLWRLKLDSVFAAPAWPEQQDAETQLYGGGFFSDSDRRLQEKVRRSSAEELSEATPGFDDKRLPTLLFRYRARNFPGSLSAEEIGQWDRYCYEKHNDATGFDFSQFDAELNELRSDPGVSKALVEELGQYASALKARLAD